MKLYLILLATACLSCSAPHISTEIISPENVRLKYNNPDLIVDLGVGLWANPIPVDWDLDGDTDLLVSTNDKPSNGLYFFENNGSNIFSPGIRIAEGKSRMSVSYPDGKIRVCTPEIVYEDFREQLYEKPENIGFKQEFYSGRANQWKYADYDGDGILDLIIGASDWREYGWDDAYNSKGEWTNGPLHGYVYWVKNNGTNEIPDYGDAKKIQAGGKAIDVYGKPSPNLVDWDNDGDLDIICGEFLDKVTFFENIGSETSPLYAEGEFLQVNDEILHLELEMPEVVVYDWDNDKDYDIIVGKEDGRVVFIENMGLNKNGKPLLAEPVYFQQHAEYLKCGALSTPSIYDWDGDGDEDIISGNTAGFIEWFENLDAQNPPKWGPPQRIKTNNESYRIMAGVNLSIQGPAEEKWGYTVPYVADWNMDGLPDIILNSIVGKIMWLPNIGTINKAIMGDAQSVKVDWQGTPPKPTWNWWNPDKEELVVQWRTRPIILDLNKDGLNDIILIDHEGYLSYFERKKVNDQLILKPGNRIFFNENGKPLQLNEKNAGKSGRRKIDFVDWDNDGDYDLLINTINTALYRNIGGNDEYIFKYIGDLSSAILGGHSTSPTTVDWNGDSVRDLLIGAEDGFFYYLPRKSWNDMQNPVESER